MKLNVYAVKDIKANCFSAYHVMQGRVDVAVRNFGDACRKGNSNLSAHPEDFVLYHLGEADDLTGELSSFKTPVMLVHATTFVSPAAPASVDALSNGKVGE